MSDDCNDGARSKAIARPLRVSAEEDFNWSKLIVILIKKKWLHNNHQHNSALSIFKFLCVAVVF